MPITINDCRCGTQGKTTLDRFTGDEYLAYCPKCRYYIEGVTRDDAIREWNEINKEKNNANSDK